MKKIIITALIIWGLFVFYKKFLASTMEPFFKSKTAHVDFMQLDVKTPKVGNE